MFVVRGLAGIIVLAGIQTASAGDYRATEGDLATIRQHCASLTQGLQTAKEVPIGLFLMACETEMREAVEKIVSRAREKEKG
jgi:hypothetical protein